MKYNKILVLGLILLCSTSLRGGEFRSIQPILTPHSFESSVNNSEHTPGGENILNLQAVQAEIVRIALDKVRESIPALAKSWNGAGLESWLSDGFYDRTRFLDTLQLTTHPDAILRVLAIDSIRELTTTTRHESDQIVFVTRVAANVRTQVEFNDPVSGLQRREGVNEFIFLVSQDVPFVLKGSE